MPTSGEWNAWWAKLVAVVFVAGHLAAAEELHSTPGVHNRPDDDRGARGAAESQPAGPRFEVAFDDSLQGQPFTGRVWVVVSRRQGSAPLEGVEWFWSAPLCARDVAGWQPGETLVFTAQNCLGYPKPLNALHPRTYRAQAIMGRNDWHQHPVKAPRNGISNVGVFNYDPDRPPTVRLRVSREIPQYEPKDTEHVKHVELKSERLSGFYGRDVYLRAEVGLPPDYAAAPQRRFPAVYVVPGFGGSAFGGQAYGYACMLQGAGLDAVAVFLDASCPLGHHVFADSANNGPWGTALVEELIPHLEERFRLIARPHARLLTGHSSGGWASLWLQIRHPKVFGGTWSTSPDPVDFRAFMRTNIYEDEANMLFEPDGDPVDVTRPGTFGTFTYPELCQLERVFGRGGQMGSFEAVFSPRGEDGRPKPLFDRETGAVDAEVAEAWKQYDIRRIIDRDWAGLRPHLDGKMYLYCGDKDEFYLDRAFGLLKQTLTDLEADARVIIVPGAGHSLPMTVYADIMRQMGEHFARADKNRQGPQADTP